MRVLVTGGAGFIGSALVRHLVLEEGHEVLNLDALTYAASATSLRVVEAKPNYRFIRTDIGDRQTVRRALSEFRPDHIIHLAAETHVDRSIDDAGNFIRTNVLGTFALLEEARHYWSALGHGEQSRFRFVHVSTDEVYGPISGTAASAEGSPYDPSSPYAASKASSDHLARSWHRTYRLPVIITNCSNNYGPYQFPEKLIPLTILNAIAGERLPVYGDGSHVRDWLHVEDHARALALIASRGRVAETYNVGARSERRNIDVVRQVCAILDDLAPQGAPHDRRIQFVDDRPGHDARYAVDPSKLEQELGWRPRHAMDRGIRDTVAWYLANEQWWRPLRDRYRGERLGLADAGSV